MEDTQHKHAAQRAGSPGDAAHPESFGDTQSESIQEDKQDIKEFFAFKEVFGYFFRKKDPSRPTNVNLKMMHGINKISIVMFLLGMLFFIVKHLF